MKSLGQIAYEAYCSETGWHSLTTGAELPCWAATKPEIKNAWERAAESVQSHRVLTCVYCGHEYPVDAPVHGAKVLTDHIKTCEKHPMAKLRRALVGVVGADTAEELDQMEKFIQSMPFLGEDQPITFNAIRALRETL